MQQRRLINCGDFRFQAGGLTCLGWYMRSVCLNMKPLS